MVAVFSLLTLSQFLQIIFSEQREAKNFLHDHNTKFIKYAYAKSKALFIRSVNITDFNMKQETIANDEYRKELNKARMKARTIDLTDSDEQTKRQFKLLLKTKEPLNNVTAKKVDDLAREMTILYETASIPFNSKYIKSIKKKKSLDQTTLLGIMATSQDPDELLYLWEKLRKTTSSKLRSKYISYVQLNNIGARENGFKDAGEFYRSYYDDKDLKTIAQNLLNDLQPFYVELHGYVRYHLAKLYPKHVDQRGPIPAHLAGSMWAHSWDALYNRIIPYPKEPSLDVTPTLKKQKSVFGMLQMAEEFFTSLGWRKLPEPFWTKSEFVKPTNRKMECFPSALDLKGEINGEPDLRIKMCIKKTQEDFVTVHHEIGHLYYNLLFWNQPLLFRDGANPGIREAIGDFVGLSVQTPAHLFAVGLLEKNSQTKEADINFLLKMALQQISFLPFAFVVDHWRWKVYSGDIKPNSYNDKWWEFREKYQGMSNPVESSETAFDPSAIFHIPGDVPYIRYFFASIFMFTFHKRACDLSNNLKPLHQCSIYNSKKAGKAFGKMLELGCSKPWPQVVKQFTGSDEISGEPIKEYFRPLMDWLKEYRLKHNYHLGWNNETYSNKANRSSKGNTLLLYIIVPFIIYFI